MRRYLGVSVAALISTSAAVLAQSTPPAPPPQVATPLKDLVLTEEQARTWIDKRVYSSDGQNLGEVAAFVRDASGRVTELHADIGGFLGMGETRVRLTPAQFQLGSDRVVVNMTAEQAKALPAIPKR